MSKKTLTATWPCNEVGKIISWKQCQLRRWLGNLTGHNCTCEHVINLKQLRAENTKAWKFVAVKVMILLAIAVLLAFFYWLSLG